MLEETPKQDSFCEMIDKLHFINLSGEGEAILTSMADSIRAALEKGLLLEQIILNERNNALKKSDSDVKKYKKKKQKNSLSSSETEIDMAEDLMKCQKETPRKCILDNETEVDKIEVLNKCLIETSEKCDFVKKDPLKCAIENYIKKTKPLDGRLKILKDVVTPKKGLVRLVDQSSLLGPNLKSLLNDSIKVNCPIQSIEEVIDNNLSLEKNLPLSPKQSSLLNPDNYNFNHLNTFPEQVLPTGEIPHGSLLSKMNPETSSPTPEISPWINTSVTNNYNFSNLTEKTHLINDYEEPLMPNPIIIKSELKPEKCVHSRLDEFLLFNQISPITDSADQFLNSSNTSGEITEIMDSEMNETRKVDETQRYEPKHQSLCKAFVLAGKDATTEDVLVKFKDLDVIHSCIINREHHSFGFFEFSSEEHLKKAIALSGKFFVGGANLEVRRYVFRSGDQTRHHDEHYNQFKRITPTQHDPASKKPRLSNSSQGSQNDLNANCKFDDALRNDSLIISDSDENDDPSNIKPQDNQRIVKDLNQDGISSVGAKSPVYRSEVSPLTISISTYSRGRYSKRRNNSRRPFDKNSNHRERHNFPRSSDQKYKLFKSQLLGSQERGGRKQGRGKGRGRGSSNRSNFKNNPKKSSPVNIK